MAHAYARVIHLHTPKCTPSQRAVRGSVRRCVRHLRHGLDLAAISERKDPERAARYIADTLRDLAADVARLMEVTDTIRRK